MNAGRGNPSLKNLVTDVQFCRPDKALPPERIL